MVALRKAETSEFRITEIRKAEMWHLQPQPHADFTPHRRRHPAASISFQIFSRPYWVISHMRRFLRSSSTVASPRLFNLYLLSPRLCSRFILPSFTYSPLTLPLRIAFSSFARPPHQFHRLRSYTSLQPPTAMEVQLYVYDLSRGLARSMSATILGHQLDAVYHTSIVLQGVEYVGLAPCSMAT